MPIAKNGQNYDVSQIAQMSPATMQSLFGDQQGQAPGSSPVTDPSAAPDPNAMDGDPSGGGGQDSNPNGYQMPSLDQLQPGQGMFISSSGGMGTFGGYGDNGFGSTPAPSGYDPNFSPSPYGSPGQVGANNAAGGGGGGGGYGMGGGSSYSTGGSGYWAPGGGLQQYPDSSNTYGQSNMGGGSAGIGGPAARGGGGANQPLGSTVQGAPNVGQTGGGFDPASPRNPFNQAQPWQGGPQGMMTMAGFKSGGTGPMPNQAYNRYQGMLADPTSMSANPAYKAIMDASLQATQRAQLARGGNGGGTMAAELARTGAGVAGQYLPQMAQMYQGGAQQEAGNWALQNQSNLGYGNLGNNMWSNAANNQYLLGNAYGQMQNGAANTQGAALAQAQMQPANAYFQNQLTMSGLG